MVEGKRILVVCSAGGHLKEALSAIGNGVTGFHLATYRTDRAIADGRIRKVHYLLNPHLSKFKYLVNAFQSALLLLQVRPKVIITTGAGIAIPSAIMGKWLGARLIVVDTVALVDRLSKTGECLYPRADLFVVQWPKLVERYPKAVYGGCVL